MERGHAQIVTENIGEYLDHDVFLLSLGKFRISHYITSYICWYDWDVSTNVLQSSKAILEIMRLIPCKTRQLPLPNQNVSLVLPMSIFMTVLVRRVGSFRTFFAIHTSSPVFS